MRGMNGPLTVCQSDVGLTHYSPMHHIKGQYGVSTHPDGHVFGLWKGVLYVSGGNEQYCSPPLGGINIVGFIFSDHFCFSAHIIVSAVGD